MSNIIKIPAPDPITILLSYDKIKVYKADSIGGTYAEITNSGTRIPLNNQDDLYFYTDSGGLTTDYYEVSFYNSISTAESALSSPVPPFVAAAPGSSQLIPNMQVIVSLANTIADTDANPLTGDLQFYFTDKYVPLYSSVRKVRLEIGSFIQNVDDDAINFAIFEASLGADQLTWIKSTSSFYVWARREWVTCTASLNLLNNFLTGMRSKRLDNFQVEYDLEKRAELLLDKVQACIDKWEKELKSGGRAVQKPEYVIKGELDWEDPHVGRMWEKGPWVPHQSGSNMRYRPFGARRYIGGFKQWRRFRG